MGDKTLFSGNSVEPPGKYATDQVRFDRNTIARLDHIAQAAELIDQRLHLAFDQGTVVTLHPTDRDWCFGSVRRWWRCDCRKCGLAIGQQHACGGDAKKTQKVSTRKFRGGKRFWFNWVHFCSNR